MPSFRVSKLTFQALALPQSDVEGLTFETSAFRNSFRWLIYIVKSVNKTKLSCFLFCPILAAREGKI